MKKRRMMVLLTCACLFAGCSSKQNDLELEQTEHIDTTETVVTTDVVLEEIDESVNAITYEGEAYTWNEITVTIPKEWEGLYTIKEEANGFSFYQTSSCEIEHSLGYLCGIYRSNSYSNAGAGDTLLAYTTEGSCYYLIQPTDVACYTEKQTIVDEYMQLLKRVSWIGSSIQINTENIMYDVNEYVIPVSSIMKVENYNLEVLTDNQLWIARNEIYARHGKQFKNEYLQAYFNTCSWYQPKEGKMDVTERELNEMELANLDLIVAAETAYDTAHPYPKKCETWTSVTAPLRGDDSIQNILYEVTKNEDTYQCMLTIDGKEYQLNKYVDFINPEMDIFYLTDITENIGDTSTEDGLEIAILDYGPSDDAQTHFFKYDGKIKYIGCVEGFPFEEQEYLNGFNGMNSVIGQTRIDLIETAYVDEYYWYDNEKQCFQIMDYGLHNYKWFKPHELYIEVPVYCTMNTESPMRILNVQKEVYFMKTDLKEWILVRGKDGTEGFIQVKDGIILNIGLPAEEVFSDLNFFG